MLFLPAVLQRSLVILGLSAMTLRAWGYLLREHQGMVSMHHPHALAPGAGPAWLFSGYLPVLAMWAVMLVAMMVPSVVPMVAGLLRSSIRGTLAHPYRRTLAFLFGYFLVWLLYCVAAAFAQCELRASGLLSPMLESRSPWLSAGVVFLAGLYQLTPWKSVCLAHCRASTARNEACHRSALGLGLHHGANCLGSCWALMGVMFGIGLMNLLGMALLGLLAVLEKTLPLPSAWLRLGSGLPLLVWGGWMLTSLWT